MKQELPFDANKNQSVVRFQYDLVRRKLAVLSTVACTDMDGGDGKWNGMGKLALKKKVLISVFLIRV